MFSTGKFMPFHPSKAQLNSKASNPALKRANSATFPKVVPAVQS